MTRFGQVVQSHSEQRSGHPPAGRSGVDAQAVRRVILPRGRGTKTLFARPRSAEGSAAGGNAHPRSWEDRFLTTILTTIVPGSGSFATVRCGSVSRLTCGNGLRRTGANPGPTPGGQGVAGSNPVSPTVKLQVRGGSTERSDPPLASVRQSIHQRVGVPRPSPIERSAEPVGSIASLL
jgi:hypothetical protein